MHIFHKWLCLPIKFLHDHKKTCVAAKILGNLPFFFFFVFDKLNLKKSDFTCILNNF